MKKIIAALLLSIPIFIMNIWILAMAEPRTQSLMMYVLLAYVSALLIAYTIVIAIEYIKDQIL